MIENNDKISLLINICSKLKNIHKDDNGYFFYGGSKINLLSEGGNNIEHPDNLEIILDNEYRLRKIFKGNKNWSNMRKSQKVVGNHLRWCFCKIDNVKYWLGKITKPIKNSSYTCKKYYLPKSIIIN
tara:strand:+ start:84 stop:464 length:381 start_codon:yes stop_codon:yes gene_type:complete